MGLLGSEIGHTDKTPGKRIKIEPSSKDGPQGRRSPPTQAVVHKRPSGNGKVCVRQKIKTKTRTPARAPKTTAGNIFANPPATTTRGRALDSAHLKLEPNLPAMPQVQWGVKRPVKVGCDFAGINVPGLALLLLGIPHEMAFVSENDSACQRMLWHHFPQIRVFYNDVTLRDNDTAENVDVYFSTFPCQAFSSAGKQRGESDCRGKLFRASLAYIRKAHPALVIFENVASLVRRFPETFDNIVQEMEAMGYSVENKSTAVTDTKFHGLPQHRPRVILVCVLVNKKVPSRQNQGTCA